MAYACKPCPPFRGGSCSHLTAGTFVCVCVRARVCSPFGGGGRSHLTAGSPRTGARTTARHHRSSQMPRRQSARTSSQSPGPAHAPEQNVQCLEAAHAPEENVQCFEPTWAQTTLSHSARAPLQRPAPAPSSKTALVTPFGILYALPCGLFYSVGAPTVLCAHRVPRRPPSFGSTLKCEALVCMPLCAGAAKESKHGARSRSLRLQTVF